MITGVRITGLLRGVFLWYLGQGRELLSLESYYITFRTATMGLLSGESL
jgi:hypothetical protein